MIKHTILFLAANPVGTVKLALDEEARAILEELERSGHRDQFELITRWAVRPLDLLRELRKLRPTVVHFSGHGGRGKSGELRSDAGSRRDVIDGAGSSAGDSGDDQHGLWFQGADGRPQMVPTAALGETFGAAGSSVKLVVLNACYCEMQAKALSAHVACVVGMGASIRDDAARTFAIGFYGGLGERQSVEDAYKQGRAAISLEGIPDSDRPQLQVRSGIDATRLWLAAASETGEGGNGGALFLARLFITLGVVSGTLFGGVAWWKSSHAVIDHVTIAGTVVDDHGPLAGATVTVEGRDFYAQSGHDGAFRGNIPGVTLGDTLMIQISAKAHRQETRPVEAYDSSVDLRTITLSK